MNDENSKQEKVNDAIGEWVVSRDVFVEGRLAFARGERVEVEKIDANRLMPRYRFVVLSRRLGTRYQLSEMEIFKPVATGVAAPGASAPGIAAPGVASPGPAAHGVATPGAAAPGAAAPAPSPVPARGPTRALLLAGSLAALAVAAVLAGLLFFRGGGSGVPRRVGTVCLDAGHGGNDTGANENGVAEKDVNLDVGLRARQLLEAAGYRVVMTREADVTVSLARRCSIANASGASALVSIHNNSRPPDVQGTTTYYCRGSPAGLDLATCVQAEVVRRIGRPDRGLRPSRLYMVRNVDMPAALLEGVFLSDEQEAGLIREEGFRQSMAEGIAAGVDAWMENR